jgi:hypothetical protein
MPPSSLWKNRIGDITANSDRGHNSHRLRARTLVRGLKGAGPVKLLDKVANISFILGVIVFLLMVGRQELARRSSRAVPPPQSLIGTSVHVPGLEPNATHSTLVLVLSTSCHFCEASLPFYKKLSDRAGSKVDIVAILPQSVPESSRFLSNARLYPKQILSEAPSSIGVVGTPTLLLVDGRGRVQEEWRGFQNEDGQKQVLARLAL